jgi:hypothetical protein
VAEAIRESNRSASLDLVGDRLSGVVGPGGHGVQGATPAFDVTDRRRWQQRPALVGDGSKGSG